MGTRSDIIVERTDGTWARVYCHWDGYLAGVGRTLLDHYSSQERAEALVAPGDMSSLGPQCTKPRGHTFDKPKKGYTVYYGRDRGDKDTETTIASDLQEAWPAKDTWTEFTYVWRRNTNEGWLVGDPDKGPESLVPLAGALAGEERPTPAVKAFGAVIGHHS